MRLRTEGYFEISLFRNLFADFHGELATGESLAELGQAACGGKIA